MEELIAITRRIDGKADEALPLLIEDDWKMAREQVSQLTVILNEFLKELVARQSIMESYLEDISVKQMLDIMRNIMEGMEAEDSIRLADILAYELGRVIQTVYSIEENLG